MSGWADIDMDQIQEGMITTHGFSNYLNTFARAADERALLIGSNPQTEGLVFEAGEIRSAEFWTKYRALLLQYCHILTYENFDGSSVRWCKRAALTDPHLGSTYVNYWSNTEFQTALGLSAYFILSSETNILNYEERKIFTGDVLRGLYTIYKMTTVPQLWRVFNSSPVLNNPTFLDGSVYGSFSADDVTGAGGETYASVLSRVNWVNAASNNNIIDFIYNAVHHDVGSNPSQDHWLLSSLSNNINGAEVTLKSLDKNSTVLAMDYIGVASCTENEGPNGRFDVNLPVASFSSIAWPIISTSQGANGSSKVFYSYNSGESPIQPQDFNADDPPFDANTVDSTQKLTLGCDPRIYVDLNNSALEFYISDPLT